MVRKIFSLAHRSSIRLPAYWPRKLRRPPNCNRGDLANLFTLHRRRIFSAQALTHRHESSLPRLSCADRSATKISRRNPCSDRSCGAFRLASRRSAGAGESTEVRRFTSAVRCLAHRYGSRFVSIISYESRHAVHGLRRDFFRCPRKILR